MAKRKLVVAVDAGAAVCGRCALLTRGGWGLRCAVFNTRRDLETQRGGPMQRGSKVRWPECIAAERALDGGNDA